MGLMKLNQWPMLILQISRTLQTSFHHNQGTTGTSATPDLKYGYWQPLKTLPHYNCSFLGVFLFLPSSLSAEALGDVKGGAHEVQLVVLTSLY